MNFHSCLEEINESPPLTAAHNEFGDVIIIAQAVDLAKSTHPIALRMRVNPAGWIIRCFNRLKLNL